MKHHFHIIFAGALLLGSLILFHNQNSEDLEQISALPDLEDIELAAELPLLRFFEYRIHPDRHYSIQVHKFNTGKQRNPAYYNTHLLQMRLKMQMDMYLELKANLDFRWGQYFCHPASFDDPPAVCA